MDIHFSPLQPRYSLEEFWALPDRSDHSHYNLIGGYLFIVPPPERTTKADTYLTLGVRELWLIDPFSATIELRHPNEANEQPVWKITEYSRGQNVKSQVVEGFEVSVSDLFAGIS